MPKINKGKVITITSMKGGVGKTTTLLSLASIYMELKKKVLIIDLDLYNGDIAFMLNANIKGTIFNLSEDVANNRFKTEDVNAYIFNYNEYIDILASPKDPRQASKINQRYIETILNNYVHKYDVILVDTNHILTPINMVAFDSSNTIINVFTNDACDLKRTKTFMSICQNVEMNNVILLLNNAQDYRKNYFSSYNMKSLIESNIDYIISNDCYLNDIDSHIINGDILKALIKNIKSHKNDYNTFKKIATKILSQEGGE